MNRIMIILTLKRRLLGNMEGRIVPSNGVLAIASMGSAHLMKGSNSITGLEDRTVSIPSSSGN